MDLFEIQVPQDQWHPNFRALMTPGFADTERSIISGWADGFEDRDGKFVKEFQTTFNSSFWELYLHAAFRETGWTCDFGFSRPDFVLSSPVGQEVVAEAVIASHAEGYRPEWDRNLELIENFDRRQVLQLATIRLANGIWSKYSKYKSSYCDLGHVQSKPFLICIAPFEQPLFFVQNDNALRRVLYGFDQPLWLDGPDGDRIVVGQAEMSDVVKDSGASIPLGFFASNRMPAVSAVIFSNTATLTKVRALAVDGSVPIWFTAVRYNDNSPHPTCVSAMRPDYTETLLDGLHICVNPFAAHPLDLQPFEGREVAIHYFDPYSSQYLVSSPDGFLFQHGCVSLVHGGTSRGLTKEAQPEYRQPIQHQWAEGELHAVGGNVWPFTDHHLAHYKGWTVLVARDTIDNDWSSQAIRGLHSTLADYHAADKSQDFLLAGGWYETKEEALQDIMGKIDRTVGETVDNHW